MAFAQIPAREALPATNSFWVTGISPSWGEGIRLRGTNAVPRLTGAQLQGLPKGYPLWAGDVLRTPRPILTLLGASNVVLNLEAESVLAVLALDETTKLRLESGRLWFESRGPRRKLELHMPQGVAYFTGTKFHLEVDRGEIGVARLWLVDGKAEIKGDGGSTNLVSSEIGELRPGKAPGKTQAKFEALNQAIRWVLYYPGVLDVAELSWPEGKPPDEVAAAVAAYQAGDLLGALEQYPRDRTPVSASERVFRAAMLLAVGAVDDAADLLGPPAGGNPPGPAVAAPQPPLDAAAAPLGAALRLVMNTVQKLPCERREPTTASGWLAESYYQQAQTGPWQGTEPWELKTYPKGAARDNIRRALIAAEQATNIASAFGFAVVRVAELEFSQGRTREAKALLDRALESLCPKNAQGWALRGFMAAGAGRGPDARKCFAQAIALDPGLANGWLGRGLVAIGQGDVKGGLDDLQRAAVEEPDASVVRSYLGKAYAEAKDKEGRALEELKVASQLDQQDPTPRLYSALIKQQENRINEAIADLQDSVARNNNRAVYRSQLLLDQDRAVRGVNLAAIYRDAGMYDVSVREASRALNYDYANGSAHLFLANSYDALRDPQQVNLRYETPWLNQLLLANLLLPVGAGSLSQTISQQEYSRLFERDHLGIFSLSEYASRGDWLESGSVYLTEGPVSASFDAYYLDQNGSRPNEDQQNLALWAKVKWQISPGDSVLLQALYADIESGDLAQYYDPASARPQYRLHETEEPILLAGYHHQWAGAPRHHTLLLCSRLNNTQTQTDPNYTNTLVFLNPPPPGQVEPVFGAQTFLSDWEYQSRLNLYSTEVQHLWHQEPSSCWLDSGSLVAGGRFQFGEFETEDRLGNVHGWPLFPPTLLPATPVRSDVTSNFYRYSTYLYENLAFDDVVGTSDLLFTVGVCYDYLHYPVNHRESPVSQAEDHRDQVSPKAGVVWSLPWRGTLRGSYTRSLGGVSFDQSFRLEPSQVAGFLQSFRSLIPESVSGALVAPRFETWGVGYDQQLGRDLYLGLTAEWLESDADKVTGVFDSVLGEPVSLSSLDSTLDFRERNAVVDVTWLAGNEFSLNARYRFSHAEYEETYGAPVVDPPRSEYAAFLHEAIFRVAFNQASPRLLGQNLFSRHRVFSVFEAIWRSQSNAGYEPDLPGDEVWQFNLFAGLRFPRRAAELRLGVLNLTDEDYRFNPLNLMRDLPRDRTLVVSLQFNLERGL
jgi:tetratricopeptide (TPR) repeat protein